MELAALEWIRKARAFDYINHVVITVGYFDLGHLVFSEVSAPSPSARSAKKKPNSQGR